MTYPEKIPAISSSTTSFNFSFSQVDKARTSVQSEYDSLSQRIEAILSSEKFFINDVPVLRAITSLNPSGNDLKKLAKAIARLSELVDKHSELDSTLNLIATLADNPHWFMSTFGDFSKEVDEDIDSLFKELDK